MENTTGQVCASSKRRHRMAWQHNTVDMDTAYELWHHPAACPALPGLMVPAPVVSGLMAPPSQPLSLLSSSWGKGNHPQCAGKHRGLSISVFSSTQASSASESSATTGESTCIVGGNHCEVPCR